MTKHRISSHSKEQNSADEKKAQHGTAWHITAQHGTSKHGRVYLDRACYRPANYTTLVNIPAQHLSCQIQNPDIPRAGRGGAWLSGRAGRGGAGQGADGSVRPANYWPSCSPAHRKQLVKLRLTQ